MQEHTALINVESFDINTFLKAAFAPAKAGDARDDVEHNVGLYQWRGAPFQPNPVTWVCSLNMRDAPLLNLTTVPMYLMPQPTFRQLH